jgi:HSP20 family molecular chaperone IbpA
VPFDWAGLLPALVQEIRIEQFVDDGYCIVRAELPGFDPEKEIELTVVDGVLRIQAERNEEKRDKAHSEFHYGRFVRRIALPPGAMEDTAVAKYAGGILEVTLTMGEARAHGRRIPVETVLSPIGSHPTTASGLKEPTAKERYFVKVTNGGEPAGRQPAGRQRTGTAK